MLRRTEQRSGPGAVQSIPISAADDRGTPNTCRAVYETVGLLRVPRSRRRHRYPIYAPLENCAGTATAALQLLLVPKIEIRRGLDASLTAAVERTVPDDRTSCGGWLPG